MANSAFWANAKRYILLQHNIIVQMGSVPLEKTQSSVKDDMRDKADEMMPFEIREKTL